MSSSAAQLPRHRGGRCGVQSRSSAAEHADAATQARSGPPSRPSRSSWPPRVSERRPRRSSPCPRPLSAMRTSVQPVGRTSGVQATGVHASGVIPGVRTARRPVSAAAAAVLSASRWIPDAAAVGQAACGAPMFDVSPWSASGLVVAARTGPGGKDGRTLAVGGSHECRRQTWAAASQAHRRRRHAHRAGRSTQLDQRQVPVGWLGEQEGAGVHKGSPQASWAGCRRDGRPGAWTERGGHATWSLRWWWSRVIRLWGAHPVRRGAICGRSAAAIGEERCPLGADAR